jgi:hypothetical protein
MSVIDSIVGGGNIAGSVVCTPSSVRDGVVLCSHLMTRERIRGLRQPAGSELYEFCRNKGVDFDDGTCFGFVSDLSGIADELRKGCGSLLRRVQTADQNLQGAYSSRTFKRRLLVPRRAVNAGGRNA